MNTPTPEETAQDIAMEIIKMERYDTSHNLIDDSAKLMQEYAESYHASKMKESEGMGVEEFAKKYFKPNEPTGAHWNLLLKCISEYAATRPQPVAPELPTDDYIQDWAWEEIPYDTKESKNFTYNKFYKRGLTDMRDKIRSLLQGKATPAEKTFTDDIDTIGTCANCGVEFHIHKPKEDNGGEWIKMNKQRNNLPEFDCKCWLWIGDGLMTADFNSTTRGFYGWSEINYSHYFIIAKPAPPKQS